MATVIVPPPYRGPTRGISEVAVDAADVRGSIHAVDAQYPGFAAQIFDAQGGVHRFVKLFLNGDLLDAEKLDREISAGDAVEVVAAISGG